MVTSTIVSPSDSGDQGTISMLVARMITAIASCDPNLAELVRAVALPHRFDQQVIGALQSGSDRQLDPVQVLTQIGGFSFVYEVDPGAYSFHEEVRNALLGYWRTPDAREKYLDYSRILRDHFGERQDTYEMLYHWMVVDADISFITFIHWAEKLVDYHRTGELETLIRLANEQSWALSDRQTIWLRYFQAELDSLLFRWQQAVDKYEGLLGVAIGIPDALCARVLLGLSCCWSSMSNWAEACKLAEDAVAAFRAADDPRVAQAMLSQGWALFRLGKMDQAVVIFQDSLCLSQVVGDLPTQGWAFSHLGAVHFGMRLWMKAVDYYQRSLAIRSQLDDEGFFVGRSLQNLAVSFLRLEDWDSARSYASRALAIQRRVGDELGQSFSLEFLGVCCEHQGDWDKALDLLNESLDIRRMLGAKKEVRDTLAIIGRVYHASSKPDQATIYLTEAAKLDAELHQKREMGNE